MHRDCVPAHLQKNRQQWESSAPVSVYLCRMGRVVPAASGSDLPKRSEPIREGNLARLGLTVAGDSGRESPATLFFKPSVRHSCELPLLHGLAGLAWNAIGSMILSPR